MYRTKTSFCLLGGLGSQSQPCDVITGMACTWVVGKTHPSLCPAPPQSPPGKCSKWSHSSHQTSLTRTKCSHLSSVEASSGYEAAFSGQRMSRQNREQQPFHLPWLIFLLIYRNEGSESFEGWWGLYIIFRWTISLSLCLLALHWLLITFLRHQFIPLEQELSTQGFHCAWDAS